MAVIVLNLKRKSNAVGSFNQKDVRILKTSILELLIKGYLLILNSTEIYFSFITKLLLNVFELRFLYNL